jgi:hypothetical protein
MRGRDAQGLVRNNVEHGSEAYPGAARPAAQNKALLIIHLEILRFSREKGHNGRNQATFYQHLP